MGSNSVSVRQDVAALTDSYPERSARGRVGWLEPDTERHPTSPLQQFVFHHDVLAQCRLQET